MLHCMMTVLINNLFSLSIRAMSLTTLSKLCQSLNNWLRAKSHANAVHLIPIYTLCKIISIKANFKPKFGSLRLPPMFPLTFHLVHKHRKMCKRALKFLWKCHNSGFVIPPFHNADVKKNTCVLQKKKKKKKSSRRRSLIFYNLQGVLWKKQKIIALRIRCFLSFVGHYITKKWSLLSARLCVSRHTYKKNEIHCCFALLKTRNAGIKRRLHLWKFVQKCQKNFCTFLHW